MRQGSIWQLLAMGEKAAKLPNYCILLWRLNALMWWVGSPVKEHRFCLPAAHTALYSVLDLIHTQQVLEAFPAIL